MTETTELLRAAHASEDCAATLAKIAAEYQAEGNEAKAEEYRQKALGYLDCAQDLHNMHLECIQRRLREAA